MLNPLVSIITVTWHSTKVTCEFLESLKANNTYSNIEVIVVDNGSKEDTESIFTLIYPGVKVIQTGENLGFAGGNNVGMRVAKGDYFFIVNNDTEFTSGLLEGLLDVFHTNHDAGIVCPKFHFYFEKGIIEYAGYTRVNMFTGRNSMVGRNEKDSGQYNLVSSTHYAHGGGMMVAREVVDKVGFMPEDFFLYYEELDWSEQIKRKGYKIYYQPHSLIYHKESMTTGKSSPLKTFYLTRNRIFFMRRNTSLFPFFLFTLFMLFFTIPKNTILFLVKGQNRHLRSFWKGILWQFNQSITFS